MSIITSELYDCYDYIIGLSRTECTCLDPKENFPLDFNTSYSGLFIDELQPLKSLASLEDCDEDVWDAMNKARENAIKEFVRDATRELMMNNKLRVQPYTGVIGRRRNTLDRTITKTYAGVHIVCKRVVGGSFTLKKIYTAFNFTGTVAVTIADNVGNTWGPYTLNTTADTWVENDITDLELPCWNDLVDNLEYFVYYTVGANQPRNNELCDRNQNRLIFCPNNPYYFYGHGDAYRWAESLMVGGFTTDDLSRFDDITYDYGGNNYMNGLNLEVDINCDAGLVLCKDSMNFESDPLAIATAYAILYKSASLLADWIFATPNLGYTKLINRENLAREALVWMERYNQQIEHIAANTDITKSDCFECMDRQPIHKGLIR